MTENPRVNFVMRVIFIHYQNCPVLAMKYPFLNTQREQPAHTSRQQLH